MSSNMYIKKYYVEKDKLYITGIQWPKESIKDLSLMIASDESEKKIEISIEQTAKIEVSLPIAEIYKWMREEQLEMISFYIKYHKEGREELALLRNKSKKAGTYNYRLINSDEKTEEKFCLLHSRHAGVLQISYGQFDELLNRCVITYVTQFVMKKSEIMLEGLVDTLGGEITHVCIQFRDDEEKKFSFSVSEVSRVENRTSFQCQIDLNEIPLEPYFWDFYAMVKNPDGAMGYSRMKVDFIPLRKNLSKRLIRNTYHKDDYIGFPYMTNAFNLCIQYREKHQYDSIYYKLKETMAVWTYKLLRKQFDKECRWLICEKYSSTAQDNSFYFFDYCYKNAKDKKVYYIIDKHCEDYNKVRHYGRRVIPFMSFRHMLYLQANCKLISAEPKIHFYAWKIGRGRVRMSYYNKPYVFLQHGVLGFKKLYNLSKNSLNQAKLFVTSSEFEKKIVTDYFGYDDNEVIVTGLPRWDVVENKVSASQQKEIVLMPTWRLWLEGMTNEQFCETDYFKNYLGLIQNSKLQELLKKYSAHLTFIIHPRLKQYVNAFSVESEEIKIYEFGEVPINEFLMRASLLVTDYSSTSWEMYYMHKPVIFYKFDIEQYEKSQGSYIDPRSEVIGDIVYEQDDLLRQMEQYMNHEYQESAIYAAHREKYFKYQDHNNSQRIYEKICELDS